MSNDEQLLFDLKYLSGKDGISRIYVNVCCEYLKDGLGVKEAIKIAIMDIVSKL